MSAKRTKDMLTVAVLLAAAAAAIHFYVDNMARNAAWHALYPLRAKLALSKLSCSPGSPAWMEGALRLSVERQVAPANQIAYIDAQGREFHCENGFFDKPYLSDAVTEQTRFRYASMTKLWTADAVLALVNENKIGLDTKAVDILPEIRNQTDPRMNDITVAHLLLHQGGFDRYSMLGIDMPQPFGRTGNNPFDFHARQPHQLFQFGLLPLGRNRGEKIGRRHLYRGDGQALPSGARRPEIHPPTAGK